jgi:hypothetical protein
MTPVTKTLSRPDGNATATAARPTRGRRMWVRILLGGLALWVATVVVTRNAHLIPTIILLVAS